MTLQTTNISWPSFDHPIYLTGASSVGTRELERADLGLLVTPGWSGHNQIKFYDHWAADNGIFSSSKRGVAFDADAWLAWLSILPGDPLFVALPDVLEWHTAADGTRFPVGVLDATLERSARYVDTVRELGFRPALVAQDGLGDLADVPFDVDAVFVGGSDAYKLGFDAAHVVAQANAAGLWTHIGRVNSWKRFKYSADIGAKSADGTVLGFGPVKNLPRVLSWLDAWERRN